MPSWRRAPVVTMPARRTIAHERMATQERPLRRGWTTGTCATAAAKAAYPALVTGEFPDPVEVTLPRGETPAFALAVTRTERGSATAGVIKDAGDDPDVTHGALVVATVRAARPGAGVTFRAGEGVGTVTRPGLPRSARRAGDQSGAAADDPRRDRRGCGRARPAADAEVEIAIPGGEALARQDAQPPPRHRRRLVDPRHHRDRRAVFLLGVDPFDPSRHRCRARRGLRPYRRLRPARTRRPRCKNSTICPRLR